MVFLVLFFTVVLTAGLALVLKEVRQKNLQIWLWPYLSRNRDSEVTEQTIHIVFAFCDHFEPQWGRATYEQEVSRVSRWCSDYPRMVEKHRDADGCHPKHSFFYPEEEYRKEHIDKIAAMCQLGLGEIEIHLHHDRDTAQGLREKLNRFLNTLDQAHGVVSSSQEDGTYRYAFIHGNWALDNSRRDGRWCGVNNELSVLSETGCYADFTLPSAPSDTQTSKINGIYYARGIDGKSKSHDSGVDVMVGGMESGDLMIIQGPLCLNWKSRKFGLLPRIENSDIRASSPPTSDRVDMWVDCNIHVKGRPEWRFIKIHTHGTQECDMDTLLGSPMDAMFTYLEEKYNDGKSFALHYVSAREMYNIAKAAEAGETGDPGRYRDYWIPRPPYLSGDA